MSTHPQVGDVVEHPDTVTIGLRGGRTAIFEVTYVATVVRVGKNTLTLEIIDIEAEVYGTTKEIVVPLLGR